MIDNFLDNLKGKKIALFGFGISHRELFDILIEHKALVTVHDKQDENSFLHKDYILEKGAKLSLGATYLDEVDSEIVFRSPGLSYDNLVFYELAKKGCYITSEIELFLELFSGISYGITGSDGKTTTTTLVYEIIKKEHKNTALGGNIGKPLLPRLLKKEKIDRAVIELSSFQLMSLKRSPTHAIITNITPNHLDFHAGMNDYFEAKCNIIYHQGSLSRTCLNIDDSFLVTLTQKTRGRLYKTSMTTDKIGNFGAYYKDKNIYLRQNNHDEFIIRKDEMKLLGDVNVSNFMQAMCICAEDVSIDTIKEVGKNFAGVAHRMEFCGEINGVSFYNDSIATTPDRTIRGALSVFSDKVILIAGGADKNLRYDKLGDECTKKVKTAILLGSTKDKIKDAIINSNQNSDEKDSNENTKIIIVNDMKEAVQTALKIAVTGDKVLLSPASTSFDMFSSYTERGDIFKNIVKELKNAN